MYKIEVRWGKHNGNTEWSQTQSMLTAEKAIKSVREKADLARIVCDVRAISNDGTHVIASYNPDNDMRLPGCRCMMQAKIADRMLCEIGREDLVQECEEKTIWWDRHCNPNSQYKTLEFDEIWNRAEKELPDTDGFWMDNLAE